MKTVRALPRASPALCALLAAAFLFAASALPARAQGELEYAVKATYLYKFGPFVEWPESAFPSGVVNLCILGDDPFGDILDAAVKGQTIQNRSIAIRRLRRLELEADCHILFVGSTDEKAAAEALQAVRGRPVLTVTDSASSPAAKGIVNFVIHEGRVRFEIDDLAAAENGLQISSKVLSLALAVRPRV